MKMTTINKLNKSNCQLLVYFFSLYSGLFEYILYYFGNLNLTSIRSDLLFYYTFYIIYKQFSV